MRAPEWRALLDDVVDGLSGAEQVVFLADVDLLLHLDAEAFGEHVWRRANRLALESPGSALALAWGGLNAAWCAATRAE